MSTSVQDSEVYGKEVIFVVVTEYSDLPITSELQERLKPFASENLVVMSGDFMKIRSTNFAGLKEITFLTSSVEDSTDLKKLVKASPLWIAAQDCGLVTRLKVGSVDETINKIEQEMRSRIEY